MIRNGGEHPFDPNERHELRKIVPRVDEIVEHLDTRLFWHRVYNTLKRALAIGVAVAAGFSTMAGAMVILKEALKRVWR